MNSFSRRYVLTCTAATLVSQSVVGYADAQGYAPTAQLFASLIVKWRAMLLGTVNASTSSRLSSVRAINDKLAEQWFGTMRPINSITDDLWNDAASSGQPIFRTRISLERLRIIAISWATPGARYYNNNGVLQKLRGAIAHISNNKYKSGMSRFIQGTNTLQNWWEFEIGIPLAVLDLIVILGEKIAPATRYNLNNAIKFFRPIPKYWTATNRTWFCHVVLLNAVTGYHVANAMGLSGQLAYWQGKFWEAKSALLGTFGFVTGEGFHKDGSFVMHGKYAYTGGYGVSMLQTVAGIIHLLDGTPAEFSTSDVAPVIQWVYRAFEPLMFRGLMMDMSRGRAVARYYSNDHDTGHQVIDAVSLLSLSVPDSDRSNFNGMVKHWISKDRSKDYFSSPKNMYVAQRSESILNNPAIRERGDITKNFQFRDMDRVVHRSPSFAFAISCYSNRIANYESINQENLKGWYTGSGMTYLYLDSDLDHYSDAFWPTVNSYKLPGTTIDRRTRPNPIEGRLGQTTVGGVSSGGSGVSCMQLNMDGNQLTAKKAWFMFGGYLTCLGTDINSSSPYAVDTIIENRNLGASGTNKVTIGYRSGNTVEMPQDIGTISSAKWINIAGVAGYVILNTKAFIEGMRERREGSWRDINSTTRTITTKYQRNFLRFSFRHGTNVRGGAYAYTILPKASVSFTRDYANQPVARVLNNNRFVQCVTCDFSNAVTLTGAVFWSAGASNDGKRAVASSSAPLCLLVRKTANDVEITYSDPTSVATSDIEIKVYTKNSRSIISKPEEDIVFTTNDAITIRFRPAKLNGASRTVRVRV